MKKSRTKRMSGRWSQWVSIAHWLDFGWNDPAVPYDKGVYRFRVNLAHPERGGEVVYIGRAGSHVGKGTSPLCARIPAFIAAAMGFGIWHAGGETFFKRAAHGERESPVHHLSVRDLEVSWTVDSDPICRECEEMCCLPGLPAFNKAGGRTCQRDRCSRALGIWKLHKKW